jgi:hypothetical protein
LVLGNGAGVGSIFEVSTVWVKLIELSLHNVSLVSFFVSEIPLSVSCKGSVKIQLRICKSSHKHFLSS